MQLRSARNSGTRRAPAESEYTSLREHASVANHAVIAKSANVKLIRKSTYCPRAAVAQQQKTTTRTHNLRHRTSPTTGTIAS
jgi:hypothetical protein